MRVHHRPPGGLLKNQPISSALCHAADHTVTNVRAAQKTGTKQVEVFYDISGSTSPVFVSLQVSSNGGTNLAVPATAWSGNGYPDELPVHSVSDLTK